MKGIYLASYRALHSEHNIVYQDINGKRDIAGDMLDVDLTLYDFVIATPPCNYWSRANYRRDKSLYSLNTKHLLPKILNKLIDLGIPFIVENVRNRKLFNKYGLLDLDCLIYEIGRHTYWTNVVLFGYQNIRQIKNERIANKAGCNRQGGDNVHQVIEHFINCIS